MKLTIDIPEDAYYNRQLLQYFECYSKKLDKEITHDSQGAI